MRWGFFFVTAGLALPGTFSARLEAATLQEFRVLVSRIPLNSKKEFVIEGQALMSAEGLPLRSDKISCRHEAALANPLLATELSAASSKWRCRASTHVWPVAPRLSFSDRSGFLRIGKKWYRGTLELIERGNHIWVVNTVAANDYLSSLLHGEMPRHFESEALKAQAVAARSYAVATALARRAAGSVYDLSDDTYDQVYPGAQTESQKGSLAVAATADEYLTLGSQILKSFYHAASGGHSELAENVWTTPTARDGFGAYLARPNVWDKGHYTWNLQLSPAMFASHAEIGEVVDIQISERSRGARVRRIKIIGSFSEKIISIQELERMLGPAWIKSRKFDIVKEGRTWKLAGEGWGHGVGLSQIAANAMAKAGKSYREILEFHYPQAELQKIEPNSPGKILAGPQAR